jgi:hypothetical protein
MTLESWLVIIGLVLVVADLAFTHAPRVPADARRGFGVLTAIGIILIGIAILAGPTVITHT